MTSFFLFFFAPCVDWGNPEKRDWMSFSASGFEIRTHFGPLISYDLKSQGSDGSNSFVGDFITHYNPNQIRNELALTTCRRFRGRWVCRETQDSCYTPQQRFFSQDVQALQPLPGHQQHNILIYNLMIIYTHLYIIIDDIFDIGLYILLLQKAATVF